MTRRGFLESGAAASLLTLVPRHVLGRGQTPAERQAQHRRDRDRRDGRGQPPRARVREHRRPVRRRHRTTRPGRSSATPRPRCYTDYRVMLEKREGHRRGRHRDAGPHPRRHHDGRAAGGQARLHARSRSRTRVCEARQLTEARQRQPRWRPRWATRATPARAIRLRRASGSGDGAHRRGPRGRTPGRDLASVRGATPGRSFDSGRAPGGHAARAGRRSTGTSGSARRPSGPYHPAYHPMVWRCWWDFGVGMMGDRGAHTLDAAVWALELDAPETVEATSRGLNAETHPLSAIVTYRFPARGARPPVKLTWYEGTRPPRPEELEDGRKMPAEGGLVFKGAKGAIMCGVYGDGPRIVPEELMQAAARPEKSIPRVEGSHEQDWARACKAGRKAGAAFEYSGPLTEICLLGNVAKRLDTRIAWDPANLRVTNAPEAEALIRRPYRPGWSL
ncbi:MAG: hypothetical protein MZU84_09525 [Sphingobacterium sp.]|nr:hypothetical protein [Sphingobacterium sp.]